MDKQFPTGWVLAVWVLASYLLLGTLSARGAAPPVLVLLLVLLLWFLVYAFRYRGLGNRKLVRRMHADLEGTLEGLKERVAQQEVHRLATLEHEEQARLEQERRAEGERRRASTPTRDPAVGKYADMIESRVREH
jgi:predicted Holliday junction resolvase-like endonuclease